MLRAPDDFDADVSFQGIAVMGWAPARKGLVAFDPIRTLERRTSCKIASLPPD